MTSPFFRLPRELRDQIYDRALRRESYVSIEDGLIIYYSYKRGHTGLVYWMETPETPLWMTACKQMYREALSQFYRFAECYHFHVANYRARVIKFSPFTVNRVTKFRFSYDLYIRSGGVRRPEGLHAYIDVNTKDKYEFSLLDDMKALFPEEGDDEDETEESDAENAWYVKRGFDKTEIEATARELLDENKEKGNELKAEDPFAKDEGCWRLAKIMRNREDDDVEYLALNLKFPDETFDPVGPPDEIGKWVLRFSFLEGFGTLLDWVQFSLGVSCMWPTKQAIRNRHFVIMLMQREFERIGKGLVSGFDEDGNQGGWILMSGPGGSVSVTRNNDGEQLGSIKYSGLEGFIDDAGEHFYYKRLLDADDGELRWFCEERNDTVTLDPVTLPD